MKKQKVNEEIKENRYTSKNALKQSKGKDIRGITLIALVITIIVLLILAGVTIATLTGENGILTKASESKEDTIVAQEKEAISLAYTACKSNDFSSNVTDAQLQEELEKIQDNVQVSANGNDLVVWFKNTNHRYTVNQNGQIEQMEEMTEEEASKVVDMIADNVVVTAGGEVKYLDTEISYTEGIKKLNLDDAIKISDKGIKSAAYECFIDNDGKIYTWGDNYHGQLGNGEFNRENGGEYSAPICINDIEGSALKDKNIVKIYSSIYGDSRMAIDEEGKLYAWGYNSNGELGDGSTEDRNIPICLSDMENSELKGKSIKEVYFLSYTVIALDNNGKVYTWGYNSNGELGDGSTENRNIPACISNIEESGLKDKKIVKICANASSIIAIDSDGKLYAWGYNEYGQLGDETNEDRNMPICISDMENSELKGKNIKEVYFSSYTTIALDNNGKVYTWGEAGTLGGGEAIIVNGERCRNTPVCISDLSENLLHNKKIYQISTIGETVYAIDSEKKVYSWGRNDSGQLGNGTTEYSEEPICISENISGSELIGKRIVDIVGVVDSSYNWLAIAIDEEKKIYTWGNNKQGQLGDDFSGDRLVPKCITDEEGSDLYNYKINKICYFRSNYNYTFSYITDDGSAFTITVKNSPPI